MPRNAKPQRTDLNTAVKPLPNIQAPSTQYGQGTQLHNEQAAVPMAPSSPTQVVASQQAAGNQPPLPQAPPAPLTPLGAPSLRPNEPVTNGIPTGPGQGPEALQQGIPTNRISSMLTAIGNSSQSPAIQALAQRARNLGQ